MRFNGQTLKIGFATVIIVAISFWALDSLRSHSYSGTGLTFVVGRGPVTMTNSSTEPVAVQLVGKGVRSFSVTGSDEGMKGSPVKTGTGNDITNVFAFSLPAGTSEFTVVRGSNSATEVSFVGDALTRLEATAQPLSTSDARTTLIVAAVVILGALYYISRLFNHRWISALRGRVTPAPVLVSPAAETGGQGKVARGYGDNRS